MPRAKTVKQKLYKQKTLRKPRQYLRINTNNLNNNNSNNNSNIQALREEQYLAAKKQAALAKYEELPTDFFLFRINDIIYPFKAMRFIEKVSPYSTNTFRISDQQTVEILYKGLTPDQSYYYLIQRIPRSAFTEEQEYRAPPVKAIGVRSNGTIIYSPRRGAWTLRKLPPVSFYYDEPRFNLQSEPDRTFYNPRDFYSYIEFLLNLPHLQEKAAKERQAVLTVPSKLKELQRKGLEGEIKKYEQTSKRQFPQNVQDIIEQHMMGHMYPPQYFQTRNNLQRIQTNLFQQ
jgi:hypothetical protein